MVMPVITSELCVNCGVCVADCPRGLLRISEGKVTVGRVFCLDCGHCVAVCPNNAVRLTGKNEQEIIPYNHETFQVPAENLLNFMRFRRSIRNFTAQEVTDEEIRMLIEAGRYAPTGSNRQKNKFIVIRQNKHNLVVAVLKRLRDIAMEMDKSDEFSNYIRYRERWLSLYDEYTVRGKDNLFYNAPCVICVVAKNPDEGLGRLDAGLAAENIELMANAMGLGSCFIGFFTFTAGLDKSISDMIGLQEGDELVAAMAVGHPGVEYHRTVNRNEADVILM